MHTFKVFMRMPGHTKQNYMVVKARTETAARKEVVKTMDLLFPEFGDKLEILHIEKVI